MLVVKALVVKRELLAQGSLRSFHHLDAIPEGIEKDSHSQKESHNDYMQMKIHWLVN